MTENLCPICYENIQENEYYTTKCNHSFHKSCIKNWIDTQNDKIIDDDETKVILCPYCRTIIDCFIIKLENDFENTHYKTKNIKRKSCIVNNISVPFINKQLQDQFPKAWFDYKKILFPIYKLKFENEDVYISAFLRTYLLYSNENNINFIKKKDFNGKKYYDIENLQIKGLFNKNAFVICFEWTIQVLHELKHIYHINYQQYYNTLINDLVIYSMIKLKLELKKSIYQGLYTCAMYNVINLFNKKKILLNIFIEYTDNTYVEEELKEINKVQQDYLKNEIILLSLD